MRSISTTGKDTIPTARPTPRTPQQIGARVPDTVVSVMVLDPGRAETADAPAVQTGKRTAPAATVEIHKASTAVMPEVSAEEIHRANTAVMDSVSPEEMHWPNTEIAGAAGTGKIQAADSLARCGAETVVPCAATVETPAANIIAKHAAAPVTKRTAEPARSRPARTAKADRNQTICRATAETDSTAPVGGPGSLVGTRLGNYRITGKLGKGGMGTVFAARHVTLDRKVAIKVLNPEVLDTPTTIQRFFREARAVNDVGHPNIVEVLDFTDSRDDSGQLFMVMEHLEGEDLRDRLRRGPLPPQEALTVACQVTDALTAVHSAQILHRDLKPENIYLVPTRQTSDGPPFSVKLLDFGLMRFFGERRQTNFTEPGTTLGTPAYMAPEQVLRRSLDARTDIYALGMLIYEMLAGRLPFEDVGPREQMIKAITDRPQPLSELMPDETPLPPGLEQAVMRCIAKEPSWRFQTMEELREVLDHLAGKQLAPGQETLRVLPPVAASPKRSRGALVALLSLAALMLLGLLVGIGVSALDRGSGPAGHHRGQLKVGGRAREASPVSRSRASVATMADAPWQVAVSAPAVVQEATNASPPPASRPGAGALCDKRTGCAPRPGARPRAQRAPRRARRPARPIPTRSAPPPRRAGRKASAPSRGISVTTLNPYGR